MKCGLGFFHVFKPSFCFSFHEEVSGTNPCFILHAKPQALTPCFQAAVCVLLSAISLLLRMENLSGKAGSFPCDTLAQENGSLF